MIKCLQDYFPYADLIEIELVQSALEGKDVKEFEKRIKRIVAMDKSDPARELEAIQFMEDIGKLAQPADFPYTEPDELKDIQRERPVLTAGSKFKATLDEAELLNRIYGAWLGRCIGCLLGKPVEGWHKDRIYGFLKETGNFPLKYYMSDDVTLEIAEKYKISESWSPSAWINHITGYCAADDDTNYTVLGMKIVERSGVQFTSENVAEDWLSNLPMLHACGAERIAYRNIANGFEPPDSASYRNVWREHIGAQIRADFYGYVAVGDPELAAAMAWSDARISHIKNGIYGAMFVAAALAAAPFEANPKAIIQQGLAQIPKKCRFVEDIQWALAVYDQEESWERAIELFQEKYVGKGPLIGSLASTNAAIVCLGLLYGNLDFEKTVGITVMCGGDTDCNGATAGSIVGMAIGAEQIPVKWKAPLKDQLATTIIGYDKVSLSEMAKNTMQLIQRLEINIAAS